MKLIAQLGKFFLSGYYATIGTTASIVGIILIFIPNPWAIIFALTIVVVILLWVFIKLINLLDSFFSNTTSEGYLKFATYCLYSTPDGNHVHYELHKFIQCKKLIMDSHKHEFKWSGTIDPKVTSTQQNFIRIIPAINKGEMDNAVLKFKKPLIYNEISLVEIIMDMDDSDHRSLKLVGHAVKETIHLLSFAVELKHLKTSKDARLCRRMLNSATQQDIETIEFVKFDSTSRTYRYNLFNPEPGYHYRLDWS
ncbi:MAG TPA: hypothetical protein VNW06_03505 [Cytophagaceae bacterium]|jgi:hypothetical protein|nr:hypothetical protein [Cytophagaceae bacterium]